MRPRAALSLCFDAETALTEADSAATLAALIADDAIIVDDRGDVQTKSQWMDARLVTDAAKFRLATATAHVFDDAARVVGQLRQLSSSARALTFTHVWIRHNGDWQIVASQSSPIEAW